MPTVPPSLILAADSLGKLGAHLAAEGGDPDGPRQQIAEPLRRAAVSRAYYGVFHIAFSLATNEKKDRYAYDKARQGGRHEQLWVWMAKRNAKGKALSRRCKALRDLRTIADYHLDDAFLYDVDQVVEDATTLAEDLMAFFGWVPNPSP